MELAKQHFAIGKQSMREKYRILPDPVKDSLRPVDLGFIKDQGIG